MAIPNIPETKWIKDAVQNGKDFLKESVEVQDAIKELKELKKLRLNRLEELKNQKQEDYDEVSR